MTELHPHSYTSFDGHRRIVTGSLLENTLADDQWGNVTLSSNVPSTGAGIATLNPIPEVPAGDVDLIAPLGTIDAGEAGIRVSGNESAQGDGAMPSAPATGGQSGGVRYDRSNPVQIVGNGQTFDARGWAQLTDDERRQLRQDY